jgi:hypothetical protein
MSKSGYGHSASEFSLGVQHYVVVLSSVAGSIKVNNTTFQHHVAVYCTVLYFSKCAAYICIVCKMKKILLQSKNLGYLGIYISMYVTSSVSLTNQEQVSSLKTVSSSAVREISCRLSKPNISYVFATAHYCSHY